MSEQLHTLDKTGARAGKIRVGIHSVNASILNGGQIIPPGSRLQQGGLCQRGAGFKSARRYHDNFRLIVENLFPADSDRIGAGPGIAVFSSGPSQHLRNPMSATVDWIDPL